MEISRQYIRNTNLLLGICLVLYGAYWGYFASIRYELYRELKPVQLDNCDMKRFGRAHDGGYLLCKNLLPDLMAAYSYGIAGRDSWGCAVSSSFNVPVHQYDCFDLRKPLCHLGEARFHGECIGESKATIEGRKFDSLSGHRRMNGDINQNVVVKLDVEGAEVASLLAEPDSSLENIQQLIVEFHAVNDPSVTDLLRKLKQSFFVADVHFNNYSCAYYGKHWPLPGKAFEVLFVNKEIAELNSNRLPPAFPNPLWAPNQPALPDCQLNFHS